MVDGTQQVAERQEDFDFDSIVLRRADPDDLEEIMHLPEIGTEDIYNRVYSFPNILKLIETAYLAITAIDRDGRVVAFAAFEDHPQVSHEHSPRLAQHLGTRKSKRCALSRHSARARAEL